MIVYPDLWDETAPSGDSALSLGDDSIRAFKRAIRERLAADHVFAADESGNNYVGYHNTVTGVAQGSNPVQITGASILYTKTVSGITEWFFLNDANSNTPVQITSNGYLIGDNVLYSNNVAVRGLNAAGNSILPMIKINTSNLPELPDGTVTTTTAAPTVDNGVANKKYVDTTVAASVVTQVGFGAWVSEAPSQIYLAATDGIATAYHSNLDSETLTGYTDSNSTPTTIRVQGQTSASGAGQSIPLMMPVRKGDYWRITASGGASVVVWWLPLGS